MYRKLKPYLLLMPVLIILIGIFVSGLMMGFIQSLGHFKVIGLTEFTFDYYKKAFLDPLVLNSIGYSLYISLVSSLIATILGVLLAYILTNLKDKGPKWHRVYKLPIIIPHIIAVLLVYNLFSQSGIIARILYQIGLINSQEAFSQFLYEPNGIGIILVYIWKEIPFVAMTTYTILMKIDNNLVETAANLGAKKSQIFWFVQIPLIMPTVLSTFIIIFAFSFGAYEVPFLLGSIYPKALPVKAFIEYSSADLANRPYAMAINMILVAVSLICVGLYYKSLNKLGKWQKDKE